ncbi:unnamed protein product [Diatraea saccharalis]|uniref:SURF1-like protein n=1 Tax=Diatraea saccharalis TaxID=40085 RepID=A0A9N9QSN3_9NEOP|nr:unnamed protein product [Diatraea saccharalis]
MANILRSSCKLSRLYSKLVISNKVVFKNTLRSNTNIANALKSHQVKSEKEPGQIFKWILLMFPVTSFGLGCWQVHRLQWKLNLIDMMQAKSNSVPTTLPDSYEELEKMEYMPVKVKGQFLHDKEFVIGPKALIDNSPMARVGSLVSDPKKNQGWLIVTPFRLSDSGQVILINRGWVPTKLKPKETRDASMIKGEVELVGVVRLTEKRAPFMPKNNPANGSWYSRDLEQMSEYLDCLPIWLDVRGISDPPAGWPIPNQTRVTLRNEHFSYLVTWYLLSIFTAIMWHRYFIKKLPLM